MRTKRTTKQEKTAVIYARARAASPDEENQAIQAQLSECREWAEKRGYSVAKAYIDQAREPIATWNNARVLKSWSPMRSGSRNPSMR